MTWPTKDDFVDGDVLTAAQVNNIANNLNEADPTGITDGYVLTADGAGGMGWEIAGGGWTLITSGTATGVGSVAITSIPQTYRSLMVVWSHSNVGITQSYLRFNNANSIYSYTYNYSPGFDGGSNSAAQIVLNHTSTSGIRYGIVLIPNYRSNRVSCQYVTTVSNTEITTGAGFRTIIPDTSIDELNFLVSSGNFDMTYEVYGL
jgi:hypothetical protein